MSAIVGWLLGKPWRLPLLFALVAVVPDSDQGGTHLIAWVLSTTLLVLATLRQGLGGGLQLGVTGVLAVATVGYLMQRVEPGVIHPNLDVRLLLWGPALLIAAVIRRTQSLALGLQLLTLLGIAAVGVLFLATDPTEYWASFDMAPEIARVATGGAAAFYVGFVMLAVLLARRGDRAASRAEGREEFVRLSMGRSLALLAGAVFLLGLVPSAVFFANAVWVLVVGFAVQGVAVANVWMDARGLTGAWAIALYVALAMSIAVTLPLMAGLGFIDTWFDLRRRIGPRKPS